MWILIRLFNGVECDYYGPFDTWDAACDYADKRSKPRPDELGIDRYVRESTSYRAQRVLRVV